MAQSAWAGRVVPAPETRVAVVGGCGGIGRAVVAACREIGLRVAVLDLPQSIERHPPDANLILAINAGNAREVRHGFEQVKSAFGAIDAPTAAKTITLHTTPMAIARRTFAPSGVPRAIAVRGKRCRENYPAPLLVSTNPRGRAEACHVINPW